MTTPVPTPVPVPPPPPRPPTTRTSRRRCPGCDRPLTVLLVRTDDTAPYLCDSCRRGWWLSELERQGWDPRTRSYAQEVVEEVHAALLKEVPNADDE